jgi:hypothetical protein
MKMEVIEGNTEITAYYKKPKPKQRGDVIRGYVNIVKKIYSIIS